MFNENIDEIEIIQLNDSQSRLNSPWRLSYVYKRFIIDYADRLIRLLISLSFKFCVCVDVFAFLTMELQIILLVNNCAGLFNLTRVIFRKLATTTSNFLYFKRFLHRRPVQAGRY